MSENSQPSGPKKPIKTGPKNILESVNKQYLIDGHLHVQSARCTPLPFVWGHMGPVASWQIGRGVLNFFSWAGSWFHNTLRMGHIGNNSTFVIAEKAVEQNALVKNDSDKYGNIVHGPIIALPMDMSFAHYDGYKGEKIYKDVTEEGKEDCYQYHRRKWTTNYASNIKTGITKRKEIWVTEPGPDGRPVNRKKTVTFYEVLVKNKMVRGEKFVSVAPPEDAEEGDEIMDENVERETEEVENTVFNNWNLQVKHTEMAAVRYPFQIVPTHHIEPRRYIGLNDGNENYSDQISKIATTSNAGIFVGIKMYCSQGYQPKDPKIKFLKDLSYYNECASKEIPIMCHHSPDGAFTHEREFYYYNLEAPSVTNANVETRKNKPWLDFFQENFVHPKSWDLVLSQVNNLKLCLAHFGGGVWKYHNPKPGFFDFLKSPPRPWQKDWVSTLIKMLKNDSYVNFFTDLSYFDYSDNGDALVEELIKPANKKLLDKIIFGTDWYMLEGADSYNDFTKEAKKYIDKITKKINQGKEKKDPDYIDVWQNFTFINPMRFYGFDNLDKLKNLKSGIRAKFRTHIREKEIREKAIKVEIKRSIEENFKKMESAAEKYTRIMERRNITQ